MFTSRVCFMIINSRSLLHTQPIKLCPPALETAAISSTSSLLLFSIEMLYGVLSDDNYNSYVLKQLLYATLAPMECMDLENSE